MKLSEMMLRQACIERLDWLACGEGRPASSATEKRVAVPMLGPLECAATENFDRTFFPLLQKFLARKVSEMTRSTKDDIEAVTPFFEVFHRFMIQTITH